VGLIALGHGDVEHVARVMEPLTRGRLGVSPVVDGLAGVAVAYRLAWIALRTLPPDSIGVAVLDRRLPSALLVGQKELGERLAESTLGAVLELDPETRATLLDTLDVYLSNRGSAARAAELLYCHRNTILNRLRRIEARTGLTLSDPLHIVELYLALEAVKLGAGRGHPGPPDPKEARVAGR
jgi:sugar diacid utilization regulator